MIKFLRIQNLATIEEVEMDFEKGFSILTGETGTGKSIIIEGLRLILGEKGTIEIIRTGKKETSVEAIFETENGKDVLIHRQVRERGPAKGHLNGTLVPVKTLKRAGQELVDIYGQNDHIFLRDADFQLDYLDTSAGLLPLKESVAKNAQEIRRLVREKKELETREKERERRLDFLNFQIKEIEQANLDPHEEDELRQERDILKNAEKISGHIEDALLVTSGEENSLSAQLAQLQNTLFSLLSFAQEFKDIAENIDQFSVLINEFTDFLYKFNDSHVASPEKLDAIEERLSTIENLKRKYGSTVQEVLSFLDKAKAEKNELEFNQEKLEELSGEISNHFETYKKDAGQLSRLRHDFALKLEEELKNEISFLGMKKADFRIDFRTYEFEEGHLEKIREKGCEEIEFLISPNPGEGLRPLRKIASGGELSRIMLALKSIGKDTDKHKTLIFDEIDSGIGGKTAEFIARKLRSLARFHQVICITHLPQIASFADHHYKIEKTINQDRTFTTAKKLSFDERVEELSRLLSGSHVTEATLKNAREMLQRRKDDA